VTADDEVDELYGVRPEEFTALRTKLVAAARRRGDAEDAKRVAAARRPTTAAWVVNTLVRRDGTAQDRLGELSEQLRAAHASMDGSRIRELSASQRKLVDELVRVGFEATGLVDPSAALRDDVTGTLQAAIADPDVAARLGRLTKAERWSGFGEFGSTTAVAAPRSAAEREPAPPIAAGATKAEVNAARKRRAIAAAEAEAAQMAHSAAIEAFDAQKTKLNTARRRYEKLLESLNAAERELNAADADHGAAERAVRDAAQRSETAKSVLAEADSGLAAVTAHVQP
jgi:hypothetical protein